MNKVDRPNLRPQGEVENEIFDLFVSLGANDTQLDYPTLYLGRSYWNGWRPP